MKTLQQHLESIEACSPAREWARNRTARQAWAECGRADWLIWWAGHTPANTKQQIVLAAETWAAAELAARAAARAAASATEWAAPWVAEWVAEWATASEHRAMCAELRKILTIPWEETLTVNDGPELSIDSACVLRDMYGQAHILQRSSIHDSEWRLIAVDVVEQKGDRAIITWMGTVNVTSVTWRAQKP